MRREGDRRGQVIARKLYHMYTVYMVEWLVRKASVQAGEAGEARPAIPGGKTRAYLKAAKE